MRKGYFLIALALVVFSIGFVSAATTNYVSFYGVWGNGSTMYSNVHFIENGTIYGKDAYSLTSSGQNARVRECYNITKVRTRRECYNNTLGYRVVTRRRCSRIGGIFGETVCEEKQYNVTTRRKKICQRVPYNKTYTRCKWVRANQTSIGCNNSDGTFTNKLSLSNYQYSFDNSTWVQVPYVGDAVAVWNKNVTFKLDIPKLCNNKYKYNRAVKIRRV